MSSSVAGAEIKYSLAVVPRAPSSIIKRDWMPLVKRISEASGVALELKFYRSIPEFETAFLKGKPDFVYLNPYHAVIAKKAQGYIPLVRDEAEDLVGILVVRKDGPLKSISDLNGNKLVFPSPNAFAASLYMRALLTSEEKIKFSSRYVVNHSNVYRHVMLGKAAAGGGVNRTFNKEPRELQDRLRIIYETPGVPPHPLCAHPRVAPSVRQAVSKAILNLRQSREGRELLKAADLASPVAADYDRDYKEIELLGFERFAVTGGK